MITFDAAGSAAQASPFAPAGIARSVGRGKTFRRLISRGAVLLMFTLGLYRFWLTNDIRRYFWSNTELAGESFEYTGTAYELLLGFLIALAILGPFYAAFFLLTCASLPSYSHHLSGCALPSDRISHPLFRLRGAVVGADRLERGPCLSVCPVSARAF